MSLTHVSNRRVGCLTNPDSLKTFTHILKASLHSLLVVVTVNATILFHVYLQNISVDEKVAYSATMRMEKNSNAMLKQTEATHALLERMHERYEFIIVVIM